MGCLIYEFYGCALLNRVENRVRGLAEQTTQKDAKVAQVTQELQRSLAKLKAAEKSNAELTTALKELNQQIEAETDEHLERVRNATVSAAHARPDGLSQWPMG